MSRYQSNYNSNESRRSPRQQSPGRYDVSDDFRGGASRERRRSNPDIRTNKSPFISNRELFRNSMSRESPRNFPREPPRGPKGVPDAPTGPRASSYGDFRNDFSLQGDMRSERGRGRGRCWRDESRDKGRELERDYRDRRDERFTSSVRDDRSRDRWASHDVYNNVRRPPSPYGRGRSPIISQRDARETQNLELERTRRGSRDATLTTGPSSSEKSQHLVRGFGKSRGSRGRVRSGFYDEHLRIAGPSRSLTETGWNRRTQPSATPPPPVPAFGSASNSVAAGNNPPTGTIAITHGLIPGVTVPTAPRSERKSAKTKAHSSTQSFNENSHRELIDKHSGTSMPPINMASRISSPVQVLASDNINYEIEKVKGAKISESKNKPTRKPEKDVVPSLEVRRHSTAAKSTSPIRKRRPIIGKRSGNPSGILIDDEVNTSDSDSEDDFGDEYFEKEIEKVKAEIDMISVNNPLLPRAEPKGIFLSAFIRSDIMDVIEATEFASLVNVVSFENEVEIQSRILQLSPTITPLSDRSQTKNPKILLPIPVDTDFPTSQEAAVHDLSDIQNGMTGSVSAQFSLKNNNLIPAERFTSTDLIRTEAESDSGESILLLDAVRKRMKTPPITSLPRTNRELWFRDLEFLKSLEPNPIIESKVVCHLAEISARRKREQDKERQRWASRYHRYRIFTDRSNDLAAIRSRDRFLKSRAKSAAAAAAASPPSVLASAGSKPKGSRRVGSRFATEHELQRVLLQSEQEAKESKESKEQKERFPRTSTTIAKEAIVPNMLWDKEERDAIHFEDRSGLISFERSFARLEFGEPIDNFTKEETISFERLYFESPKQWGKIAESIPNRDYKSCIQHYYLVKHPSNLKKKLKDHSRRRKGRQSKAKKEKTIASTNDQGSTRDDDEALDGQADGRTRRPRRAAAPTFNSEIKDQANDTEVASPIVISTTNVTIPSNNEQNSDTPIEPISYTPSFSPPTPPTAPPLLPPTTSVKRKAKAPREKAIKQAKNNQTPASASLGRRADSPPTPLQPDLKARRESENNAHSEIVSGDASPQPNLNSPLIVPTEKTSSLFTSNVNDPEKAPLQIQVPEMIGTTMLSKTDLPQTQKNLQQTSSYWSVPEQEIFSALLGHFGTNWHGIAKYMTTKTHIMVKNHYQRQVDSGKMKEWEIIAKAADEKIERAEPTGPLPLPTVIPTKRRLDTSAASTLRSDSATDVCDDVTVIPLVSPSNGSTPQPPSLSPQDFPIMSQTSPVPQIKPNIAFSKSNKNVPSQSILQAQPLNHQAPRARGPPLGYFDTGPTLRQQQRSDKVSQRTLKAALDAQVERELALRMEKEQREIQQQQQSQPQQRQRQQLGQSQHSQPDQKQKQQSQLGQKRESRLEQKQQQQLDQNQQSQPEPEQKQKQKQKQRQRQQPQSQMGQKQESRLEQKQKQVQQPQPQLQLGHSQQSQPEKKQKQQPQMGQRQESQPEQKQKQQPQLQLGQSQQSQPEKKQKPQPQPQLGQKQESRLEQKQVQQPQLQLDQSQQPQLQLDQSQQSQPEKKQQQQLGQRQQSHQQQKQKQKQKQQLGQRQQLQQQPQQRLQQSQSQLQQNLPVQLQPQTQPQQYQTKPQEHQSQLQLSQQMHQHQHQQLPQNLIQQHQHQHQQLPQNLIQQHQQHQQPRSLSQPQSHPHPQQHQKLLQQQQSQQKQQKILRSNHESENEHLYQIKDKQKEAQQSIVNHEKQTILQKEKHAQNESQLFSMRQENISPEIEQHEILISSRTHKLNNQPIGNEASNVTSTSSELRRSLQGQQFQSLQSRPNHSLPQLSLNENSGIENEIKSSSIQNTLGIITTSCKTQERYITSQSGGSTNVRQPEVVRKMSNIMSLLNNDEPSEARPSLHRQMSDNHSATLSSQTISSYSLPSVSHYPSKSSQVSSQYPALIPHKTTQASSPSQIQQKNVYSQQNSHQTHINSSSVGKHPRSYILDPSKFENHGYPPSSMQSQQQKVYQQASQRHSNNSQSPGSINRDISRNEIRVVTGSYSGRQVTSNQSSTLRLKESPYSATSPSLTCQSRSTTSSIDLGNTDQDYYGHQHQLQCVPSSSHENSMPQNAPQQSLAGSKNSSSATHPNRAVPQSQHSYQNPQHSQSSHSLGQPQSQKQLTQSKQKSVGQMQIPFSHPSHNSGTGNGITSQLVQYPAQILPTSHSNISSHNNHSSPGKLSTHRRSKRDSFDGRYNNQLPPSTKAQSSAQQQINYVMPLHSTVSHAYGLPNQPSSHGTSLGPHHSVQHGDMTGNYIQYEHHVRDDEYHYSRVREHEERDRERVR